MFFCTVFVSILSCVSTAAPYAQSVIALYGFLLNGTVFGSIGLKKSHNGYVITRSKIGLFV